MTGAITTTAYRETFLGSDKPVMSTTAYSCVGFRVTLSSEQHRDGIAYYYDTPTVYDMRRSDMPSTGVSSRRAHDGTHNDIVQKSTILGSLLHLFVHSHCNCTIV